MSRMGKGEMMLAEHTITVAIAVVVAQLAAGAVRRRAVLDGGDPVRVVGLDAVDALAVAFVAVAVWRRAGSYQTNYVDGSGAALFAFLAVVAGTTAKQGLASGYRIARPRA